MKKASIETSAVLRVSWSVHWCPARFLHAAVRDEFPLEWSLEMLCLERKVAQEVVIGGLVSVTLDKILGKNRARVSIRGPIRVLRDGLEWTPGPLKGGHLVLSITQKQGLILGLDQPIGRIDLHWTKGPNRARLGFTLPQDISITRGEILS